MGEVATLFVDTQQINCGECGITFWVPGYWNRTRQEDGKRFYCPNGHCRVYRESDVDKLKRRLEMETNMRRSAERAAEHAEHRRRAAAGQVTKMRKRIANGVCPRCNRTFKNVMRHVKCKHPEMLSEMEET